MPFGWLCLLFTAAILLLPLDVAAYPVWSHGWDTVAGQLAVNVGSWNSALNTTGLWEWIAEHYAAVAMNDWCLLAEARTLVRYSNLSRLCRFNRFSGPPGTDPKITAARTLKALNPGIKLLWYQAADFVSQSTCVTGQIMEHPEWWLRGDDANTTILFQGVPELDWSIPAARQWCVVVGLPQWLLACTAHRHQYRRSASYGGSRFIRLPAAGLLSAAEEAALVDGLFVDSAGYGYWPSGISQARYDASLFPGKMALMEEATAYYGQLNGGNVCVCRVPNTAGPTGAVMSHATPEPDRNCPARCRRWGNPLMQYGYIGSVPPTSPYVDWNATLGHYSAAFDEMCVRPARSLRVARCDRAMPPLQVWRLRHAELSTGRPVGRGQDGLLLQGDPERDRRR